MCYNIRKEKIIMELNIIINHCDDKSLEENIYIEESSIGMIKVTLKTHIESSFDNATHLKKRNLYPSSNLNMKVKLISSSFITSEESILGFNNYNIWFINELESRSKTKNLFLDKKIAVDEDDVIPSFSNYMEREKCFNKIRSAFTRWKAEQEIFLNPNKKKEAPNASFKKPKT
jgi:hypothetical protein